ncbi:MAG: hypothetical protein N3I86_15555, partial [Verrucomicrobiae bacterium]|nr:hypothetical protein [Verrucomicrobiae bacterium]
RLHLADEDLAHFPDRTVLFCRGLGVALLGVALFPVAAFGWVHRWLPIRVVDRAIQRFAQLSANKTHVSTTGILAGVVSFGLFFSAYIAVFHLLFGWPASLWYALSLPVASLGAHHYLSRARRFIASLRCARVLLRARFTGRRLLALRNELIAQIEAARWEVPMEALMPERTGGP